MSRWLAPAKLNLCLHVTARRDDGYHLLQTVFQFIDWFDELIFELRDDGKICQLHPIAGLTEDKDITLQAARRLQQISGCKMGIGIGVNKNIPMGAGLGGGSSNAATTLLALNSLWALGYGRQQLSEIGLSIGADVPVFIHGFNAWAQGIGEELTPIELAEGNFLVAVPPVQVSTAKIFSNLKLTASPKPITIRDFLAGQCNNQLQPVTCKLYPQVQQVIDHLSKYGIARMSGSGAAVFLPIKLPQQADDIVKSCPRDWQVYFARGLAKHPHG